VADGGAGQLLRVDPATLSVETIATTTSDGAALSIEPDDVTVDSSGNIYAVDLNTNTIIKLSPNGTQLQTFYNPLGEPDGEHQWYPLTVAVDSAGNVYAGDQDSSGVFPQKGSITKFSSNGSVVLQFVAHDVASFIPYGVRVDPAGFIYVAEYFNSRITKFGALGQELTFFNLSTAPIFFPVQVVVDLRRTTSQ
jgi:streptogramin lyase